MLISISPQPSISEVCFNLTLRGFKLNIFHLAWKISQNGRETTQDGGTAQVTGCYLDSR